MRLKLASAACCTSACSRAGAITASVATNPSMVAMFGRIMPAPLAMPVTVTMRPPMATWRDAALGTVSVVMMPWAACAQWSGRRSASAAGRPASMRSTGSVSMITPVEKGSTDCASNPISVATAAQVRRARARRQAVGAGAGIGIAGVDDDRADAVPGRQLLAAHLHRRCAEAVLGEDAGHGAALVEREQHQVAPVGLADAGHRGADAQAGDGVELVGSSRQVVHGHGVGSRDCGRRL